MRLLARNKTAILLCYYLGKVDIFDSEGNMTGEKAVQYSEPQTIKAHISKASGTASVEMFGVETDYDKAILIDNELAKGIDENTVFFIDKLVEFDEDRPLYDYSVVRIAKTLNVTAVAVKKVRND